MENTKHVFSNNSTPPFIQEEVHTGCKLNKTQTYTPLSVGILGSVVATLQWRFAGTGNRTWDLPI